MRRRTKLLLYWYTLTADIVDIPLRLFAPCVRRRVSDEVDRAVAGRRDALVVDLFTGTGSWLAEWAGRCPEARVLAVDRDPGILRVAQERVEQGGWHGMRTVAGDARDLPLAACAADAVTVSFGLHESSKRDRDLVLGEACRVLRTGGTLVVVDYREARGLLYRALATLYFRLFEPRWIDELFCGRLERQVQSAGFDLKLVDTDMPMSRLIVARK